VSNIFAVDVGGTFTDLYLFNEETGEWQVEKRPTTAEDITNGIFDCLNRVDVNYETLRSAFHGSTVADNAIIERKIPPVALITTEGFRDLLEMGRWWRPQLYDLQADKPQQIKPLIPRQYRFSVPERIGSDGEIVRPLDEDWARNLGREIREKGIESVAIMFMNSYVNPIHEERMAEILKEECPGLYLSISSRILPKVRELSRLTTTVVNACIVPIMDRYLERLQNRLGGSGYHGETLIMQSNGGLTPIGSARETPVYVSTSGPAAGVMGASYLGSLIGRENIIAFDMGGTTAKASLVHNGAPFITNDFSFEWDTPIAVPMIHMSEVGAGGGSIAWVDNGGMLQVGPISASAVPGPACYGRGGEEPTITDANLVLGHIDPESFLGGRMPLYPEKSRAAVEKVSHKLGISVEEAASGIIAIAETTMAEAVRSVSLRRGYDPRDFTMVIYGGAGPMHGVSLAQKLGVREVVVPVNPGVFSAFGMCNTDIIHDFTKTVYANLDRTNPNALEETFGTLEAKCLQHFEKENILSSQVELQRFGNFKYESQAHELEVPIPAVLTPETLKQVINDFHQIHETHHGFLVSDEPVTLTDIRVAGINRVERVNLKEYEYEGDTAEQALITRKNTYFEGVGYLEAGIYLRDKLRHGNKIVGPAVIMEHTATTVIPPNAIVTVDRFGNLAVEL
jgi:N-methylhydantoinase A